ncbi:hypothetical protein CkaCkLH20_04341 [Colletotrichum karsti]|uniref:RING-type domain-containing protein n=1 Tax=Colletotrichum karsti TaxID=1095194 RepID=A0A9P6I6Q7_9PEZI|nr:uncharacterized protein CkaCkLH20_04341 [Colletotrichum karsti]KAF9878303.1 hypothetical protein CkaCkLH20_04341 [Colletotrichum karsti]
MVLEKKPDVAAPADGLALQSPAPMVKPRDLTARNCDCDRPNTEKPYIFTRCGHSACQSCVDNRGTCCGKMQNLQLNYQAGESTCQVCLDDTVSSWCVLVCGHRTCKDCFNSIAKDSRLRKCPTCRRVFQVGYITAPDA